MLSSTLHDLKRDAVVFGDPSTRLRVLPQVVQSIGREGPIQLRDCPAEYREQWRTFIDKRRVDLERRASRFLCWDPGVGTDARFHSYLEQSQVPISSRALQGLLV